MFVVRNTFIDVGGLPEPTALTRGKTVPSNFGSTRDVANETQNSEDEVDEDEVDEDAAAGAQDDAHVEVENPKAGEEIEPKADDDAIVAEHPCVKMKTMDCLEDANEWSWIPNPPDAQFVGEMMPPPVDVPMSGSATAPISTLQGQAAMPASAAATSASMMPAPVASGYADSAALAPAATPSMYIPPGSMMVPMVMVPMIVPIPGFGDSGMTMMPMEVRQPDRGVRWPADIQKAADNTVADTASTLTSGSMIHGHVAADPYGVRTEGIPNEKPEASPQPLTLTRSYSVSRPHLHRVNWAVDAKKLKSTDKQVVSPLFEMSFRPESPSLNFRMILSAKAVSTSRRGESFKKARGFGLVQLKCDTAEPDQTVANVRWRIMIGQEVFRGPVTHNFLDGHTSRLPEDQEEWDLKAAVEERSQTFVICLEIAPENP